MKTKERWNVLHKLYSYLAHYNSSEIFLYDPKGFQSSFVPVSSLSEMMCHKGRKSFISVNYGKSGYYRYFGDIDAATLFMNIIAYDPDDDYEKLRIELFIPRLSHQIFDLTAEHEKKYIFPHYKSEEKSSYFMVIYKKKNYPTVRTSHQRYVVRNINAFYRTGNFSAKEKDEIYDLLYRGLIHAMSSRTNWKCGE